MPRENISTMSLRTVFLSFAAAAALSTNAVAATLHKGTQVTLAFDQPLSSRTAHTGDTVRLHVVNDVSLGNRVVIHSGEHVTARITSVQKNGRFGKNGELRLDILPLHLGDTEIPLQPRQKGNVIGGTRGTKAAGAAGVGALVLGPLGLGAGYFVVGKSVNVHPGDKLETQVSRDVHIH